MANTTHKLNWLRAAVLGANDGIVSVAGLVIGVAGATNSATAIFMAGVAGIVAGAIAMAAGEFVSVSSSKDTEKAILEKERYELKNYPEKELKELAQIYRAKGLTEKTAELVAKELSKKDVFAAHAHAELSIDPNNLTNPWHAAFASAGSFLLGAAVPLIAIVVSPAMVKIPATFISVVIALGITGVLSAKAGGAKVATATIRVVVGGALAMIVTFIIGKLFAISGI
jgi:VIT1/CCC1 family predicted Fe2+/Mn2+ transporter